MGDELVETFNSAADYLTTIAGNLDSDSLLYLYARYKQSIVGKCNTPKPGFFDFQGKQKWEAWRKLADTSKSEAMTQYIQKIGEIDSNWKNHIKSTGNVSRSGFGGPVVSTMKMDDCSVSDADKTPFDWVKEGKTDVLENIICESSIDAIDEQGMTLLHWACDRGHIDVVKWLILHKANVNVKDNDGQSPLHYASSCEYLEIVKYLLENDANSDILDSEGLKPVDVAANAEISQLLR